MAILPFGMWWIIVVYLSYVHVSRRLDRWKIVRGWERKALDVEEYRRFRPFGKPPPVVRVGVRCWRCSLPELSLPSRGMVVARTELLVAILVFLIHPA